MLIGLFLEAKLMRKITKLLHAAVFTIPLIFTGTSSAKGPVSEDHIKQQIISESIASYPGVCACPFNSTRNGSSCGGRSAWSRGGGYSPICYKKEVTKEMIKQWKESHSNSI